MQSIAVESSDTSDSDAEKHNREANLKQSAAAETKVKKNAKPRKVKFLLLGGSGVGKTSLRRRWTGHDFQGDLVSTTGVDFDSKPVEHKGLAAIAQIWDTAGQERFHIITHSYYRGVHGLFLVYDGDNATAEKLGYWLDNIRRHGDKTVEVIVICNKIDLLGPAGMAEFSGQVLLGRTLANDNKYPLYLTSAQTGEGCDEVFNAMVEKVLQKFEVSEHQEHEEEHRRYCKKVGFKKCRSPLNTCSIS